VRLLVNLAMAIVILFGGQMLGTGTIYIGDLFSYLILLNFAIEPLFFINTFLGNTAMYLQTTNRITEILNNDQVIKEPPSNRIFELTQVGRKLFDKLKQEDNKSSHEEDIEEKGEVKNQKQIHKGGNIDLSKKRESKKRKIKDKKLLKNLEEIDDLAKKIILLVGYGIQEWYEILKFLENINEENLKTIFNQNKQFLKCYGAKWLPKSIKGIVKFDRVWLSYRGDEFYELKDISFETEPGEVIAILGATGSGKTSIIRLIGRFYENNKGKISIDGMDIREITKKELRTLIGFVPQESFLFSTTLRENLSLGRPEGVNLDEIINACKLANIHDFIDGLPKKYETVVGQRGVTLSGGQRQRVSIARAIIKKPKILILDDATSSVDVDTEFNIQQSFSTIFADSTTFIITQRLSSVRHADRIMVLEKGRIKQFGTHEELMADTENIYYKLYTTLDVEGRAKISLEAVGGK
ncbi:MAG: ATP-binding cassette domain-containing protein, partial [Candidatus Lokiarchaeota archaeon]|nr:ATP-binding cassette domain-containing protein [Candidatus Lokiarchaeota archaeon]